MRHKCHIPNCATPIKPQLLMCSVHWKMVNPILRKKILNAYRPGQCDDKRPSKEWLILARMAITEVRKY